MISRTGLLALACLALASAGCVGGRGVVNTVPWWKGLPCMVIAPSSLEAYVWRQHLHRHRAGRSPQEASACSCDPQMETEWSESEAVEPADAEVPQPEAEDR